MQYRCDYIYNFISCDSEMVEVLPIVDVNSSTVKEVWSLLLRSIDTADFVALDMVTLL